MQLHYRDSILFEKIEVEKCDQEFVCEFGECQMSEFQNNDEKTCWREECVNECEDRICSLWIAEASNDWQWRQQDCPPSPGEQFSMNVIRASRAFNGTLTSSFEAFCPDSSCIEQHTVTFMEQAQLDSLVNSMLSNNKTVEILNLAFDESAEEYDLDHSSAQTLVNSGDSPNVGQLVSAIIEDLSSSDDRSGEDEDSDLWGDIMGYFISGDKN